MGETGTDFGLSPQRFLFSLSVSVGCPVFSEANVVVMVVDLVLHSQTMLHLILTFDKMNHVICFIHAPCRYVVAIYLTET